MEGARSGLFEEGETGFLVEREEVEDCFSRRVKGRGAFFFLEKRDADEARIRRAATVAETVKGEVSFPARGSGAGRLSSTTARGSDCKLAGDSSKEGQGSVSGLSGGVRELLAAIALVRARRGTSSPCRDKLGERGGEVIVWQGGSVGKVSPGLGRGGKKEGRVGN